MKRIVIFMVLFSFLGCVKEVAPKKEPFPKPTGTVNDFANIIDMDSEKQLTELCKKIKDRGLAEIAICTIDSIPLVKSEYKNPMIYATDLFNDWGIGGKNKNDGLLIFVSVKNRKATICTGSFTQHVLSDSTSGRILDKVILPNFKNHGYGKGIIEGVKVIEYEIDKNLKKMNPGKVK